MVDPEIERLRKKVENYPSPSAYNRLAELLRDNNDDDGVIQVCRRSMREFKRNSKAYVILAQVYVNQGKRPDAVELLQDAIAQDPRSIDAFSLLADIHEAKGSPQEAVSYLQKALELSPGNGAFESRIQKLSSGVQSAAAPAVAAGKPESGTIDMTGMSVSMTSSATEVSFDAPAPRTSAPVSSPAAAAAPAATAPAATPTASPLAPLLAETGIQGIVVADDQGRVVSSELVDEGKANYFAALAHEVSNSCEESLGHLQHAPMANWSITTDNGLLLAFRRNPALTLLVSADTTCKVAMIELRARQALIDLGGA